MHWHRISHRFDAILFPKGEDAPLGPQVHKTVDMSITESEPSTVPTAQCSYREGQCP